MTGTKSSKPKGKNGKSRSLKDEVNKKVNAAEEKVREIEEQDKPNPSDVANDLEKANEQVNSEGKANSTKSSKTKKKSNKSTTSKAESESKAESGEKGENSTKDNTATKTEESTGIDPNKALNPTDFEVGTGAKDSSMDLYTRFAAVDPKNLRDPYGNPIDWNSVDGKSDIDIGLGDRVLTIPKQLAGDMANSIKNNQYDQASLTVARSLGLNAKSNTNAAYIEKGADLSRQGEKYLKKLMEDPNTPGLTRRLLTYLFKKNLGKTLTVGGIGALGYALYKDAKNDVEDAEDADKALEDSTPIDVDSVLNEVPKDEDIAPGKLAVGLGALVNDPDTDVGTTTINGHDSNGENGESDNPDNIEQASDSLNEVINGIPSHLPQDAPDEEEGTEAAAKEYNPTYTPKQEMYKSLESSTAEPRRVVQPFEEESEDTIGENQEYVIPDRGHTSEDFKRGNPLTNETRLVTKDTSEFAPYNPSYTPKDQMYNTGLSNPVPKQVAEQLVEVANTKTPSKSSKKSTKASKAAPVNRSPVATPVNNAPMASSRPNVSAPGYGAADLSAALGQAAQGAPVDGYDRMFDPSFLEYMRRVSPNVAFGIEQEMRRRGMM